jgi:hypothetical protein
MQRAISYNEVPLNSYGAPPPSYQHSPAPSSHHAAGGPTAPPGYEAHARYPVPDKYRASTGH